MLELLLTLHILSAIWLMNNQTGAAAVAGTRDPGPAGALRPAGRQPPRLGGAAVASGFG